VIPESETDHPRREEPTLQVSGIPLSTRQKSQTVLNPGDHSRLVIARRHSLRDIQPVQQKIPLRHLILSIQIHGDQLLSLG
jgi:hypothetical protein